MNAPTALIADDEPLLRRELQQRLLEAWPELRVVAQARNGREAIEMFEARRPDVCFLDIRMPGITGVEVARQIGARAHIVFVTAYDQYAIDAFTQGATDYLLKPVVRERLAATVTRLQSRLRSAQAEALPETLLQQLAAQLQSAAKPNTLQWLRVSIGAATRLITVDKVDFLRSDEKYTRIGWRDEDGKPNDAVIRTPLKELLAQLDPAQFVQVHRSAAVALRAVDQVVRDGNDTATIHLKGHDERLPVSRAYLHLFRQM